MKVHYCPSCNTYSKDCIIVIQNAPHLSEERLKCSNCSWSGKWSDMEVKEYDIPFNEGITDYLVLHSDKDRIKYTGGLCPHCGGDDPLCWCQTIEVIGASCPLDH